MLGHLKPTTCGLPSISQRAYKNYYCSICASLRKQNNVSYTFFINNELTLVLLALQPYIQAPLPVGDKPLQTRCPATGFTKKNLVTLHSAVDMAAQLSVLLGWIKVTDWAYDQPNFFKGLLRKHLHKKTSPLLDQLSLDFQQTIQHYLKLTQTHSPHFEELCQQSGALSRQITLAIGAHTSIAPHQLERIAQLFYHSGILILLTDHLLDLTKDIAKNQYNPIISSVKHQQIGWDEAYYTLRQQFNREKLKVRDLTTQLLDEQVIHSNFSEALNASLRRMEIQVKNAKPDFIGNQFLFEGEEVVIVKNDCDCDCDGCECHCCNCSGCSCCDSGCCDLDCCECDGCDCKKKKPK
ncbi:DUF5685 family protein [uncultured Microscilla sp.]|uniref:DUF5685 family protein n=1 Tax=uncultured Microscilla sp. TaxID=432653 RepID=UPI002638D3C1|nr:DUF5685 family protein [uncultured Microscilla sp.]